MRNSFCSLLYTLAKLMGDANAVKQDRSFLCWLILSPKPFPAEINAECMLWPK